MHARRRFLAQTAAGLAIATLGPATRSPAQALGKLTRIIVGFPAGGANDMLARPLAARLSGTYANNVIVENRVGAQGRIAVDFVKGSEPDGSVMLQTPASILTVFPHTFKNLSYDSLRDLTPVTALGAVDLVLAVNSSLPVRSLAQFVDWCKKNPDKASYGSPAVGSTPHFVGVMFASAAGLKLVHVGYKGAGQAVPDLIGGQIPAFVGVLPDVKEHHRSGKVRILATSGAERSRFVPDVPTFVESGYKVIVAQEWFGTLLPRNASRDIVTKLNGAIRAVLDDRGFQDVLTRLSFEPAGSNPEAFAARIKAEYDLWASVVKASGFSAESI